MNHMKQNMTFTPTRESATSLCSARQPSTCMKINARSGFACPGRRTAWSKRQRTRTTLRLNPFPPENGKSPPAFLHHSHRAHHPVSPQIRLSHLQRERQQEHQRQHHDYRWLRWQRRLVHSWASCASAVRSGRRFLLLLLPQRLPLHRCLAIAGTCCCGRGR